MMGLSSHGKARWMDGSTLKQRFGELVAEHRHEVVMLCLSIVGSPEEAEDLAHDAFVEAYLKLEQLREADRFPSWLRTIARNVCRMWLRRQRRHVPCPCDVPVSRDAHDTAPALADAYSQLSPDHRLVVSLHYGEGMSYRGIASFLGLPIGTVMSRLHRARLSIRTTMERGGTLRGSDMTSEPDFAADIDAEIALLLDMFREDPQAATRLSVVLEHSPERLRRLVAEPGRPETLDQLGALLPRLGKPAYDAVVDAVLGTDASARANAARVLARWASVARDGGGAFTVAAPQTYWILDRALASDGASELVAETLLAIAESASDPCTRNLVTEALLCLDTAYPMLVARAREAVPDDLKRERRALLFALCRHGAKACDEFVKDLIAFDPEVRRVALEVIGAVATGRSRAGVGVECEPADLALRKRGIAHYAAVAPRNTDGDQLANTLDALGALLEDTDPETVEAAIRAIGLYAEPVHQDRLRRLAQDAPASVRAAALHALGSYAYENAHVLLASAADDDATVRTAAVMSLRRVQLPNDAPLDVPWAGHADSAVREAAKMTRAMASVARGHLPPEIEERKRRQAEREDRRRKRLDGAEAQPAGRPAHNISVEAAVRALPEVDSWGELEITRRIGSVCWDYSTTRRFLVSGGRHRIMTRDNGVYRLTDFGLAVWRVERRLAAAYLAPPEPGST
ncbi:sigma-70 family RNA polymerase sigma factor [Candidatus Poribacteria bacterium]|nr:sigma-70 family RNA polymerase sigma factor [Candidatus Poribacteria bacterium]